MCVYVHMGTNNMPISRHLLLNGYVSDHDIWDNFEDDATKHGDAGRWARRRFCFASKH